MTQEHSIGIVHNNTVHDIVVHFGVSVDVIYASECAVGIAVEVIKQICVWWAPTASPRDTKGQCDGRCVGRGIR